MLEDFADSSISDSLAVLCILENMKIVSTHYDNGCIMLCKRYDVPGIYHSLGIVREKSTSKGELTSYKLYILNSKIGTVLYICGTLVFSRTESKFVLSEHKWCDYIPDVHLSTTSFVSDWVEVCNNLKSGFYKKYNDCIDYKFSRFLSR